MIYIQTLLNVADNSGAQKVLCINILGHNRKFGLIGDNIRVSIKKTKPTKNFKKGEVMDATIVRTKKVITRNNGFSFSFFENSVIIFKIVNKNFVPSFTRILGTIPKELKKNSRCTKLLSLADNLI
uniref:Ribosomal protein L14 n=1 Tax=Spumella sp. NIES-1846 TaxID=2490549 RepID=A0A455REE9_9STRA|nr:ribosomal protein L14 [Spumella sp. NIES-1846]